jgi:hypothetical protein
MAWNKSRGRSEVGKANDTNVGGEVRELLRSEVAALRRHPATDGSEILAANTLLQRVAGSSIQGIEIVIVELQTLRLRLTTETARVQREIAEYAMLSQTARQSTKIIAESMLELKNSSTCDSLRVS